MELSNGELAANSYKGFLFSHSLPTDLERLLVRTKNSYEEILLFEMSRNIEPPPVMRNKQMNHDVNHVIS